MKYNSIFQEYLASIKRVGVANSFLLIYSRLYDIFFDRYYAIDTVERLELDELSIDECNVEKGQMYQPSGVLAFKKCLSLIKLDNNSIFVDFGSGKGRAVLLAAMRPIKKSIGIEFSEQLVLSANENTKLMKKKGVLQAEVQNICCDATKYTYADNETIFYFFFPFDDELMEIVLSDIQKSVQRNRREVTIIYYYPVHDNIIERNPFFEITKKINLYGYQCHIFKNKES